jgi:hypothetical protein
MSKVSQAGKTKRPLVAIKLDDKNKLVATIEDFKGKPQLVFRKKYWNEEKEEWCWGRDGVNIPVSKLPSEKVEALSNFFSKLADKLARQESDDNDED